MLPLLERSRVQLVDSIGCTLAFGSIPQLLGNLDMVSGNLVHIKIMFQILFISKPWVLLIASRPA